MKILLATRNRHKTREFAHLLGPQFQVTDLTDERDLPGIVETGGTFEENAAIKAVAVSRVRPKEIVVADDSGLEVDALSGAPGICSARFAGEDATDRDNVEKLFRELERLRQPKRSARFRCIIVIARGGKILEAVSGEVRGLIADLPRGENGFGYDPVFVAAGFTETFAELPTEVKNRISHRARAVEKLRELLGS
ncbi:MAG: non-canonical purine NTP pyrophosphatase, RdgB/HAM1 family [Verrucomicrobia bacterium]|nr:MAG: non-canonical purine NTP pyrophosphatase, RdgB/HAM1 family [Verrucomicrobiota bacterium]